jgi:sphingomyelin phosphodiesterase acid-like 3
MQAGIPRFLLLIIFYMALLSPRILFAAEAGTTFLTLADIHFDPFTACYHLGSQPCPLIQKLSAAPASQWMTILSAADTSEPRYRRDTNTVLLQNTLREAKQVVAVNHPDFILVLGDSVGHEYPYYYKQYARDKSRSGYQNFVHKTLEFLNLELASAFPGISIIMVTGNNDTYSKNYQSIPGGAFFQQTGALWSTLVHDPASRTALRTDFSAGGYYALDMPHHPELRLIVLNSVLFSVKSSGRDSGLAATAQFDWLHQQLQYAKDHHQKIMIALHIPPSVDVYAMRHWHLFTFLQLWRPEFAARFKSELALFYPQLLAVFSGHLHYDWSEMLGVGDHQDIPVISVASVSPVFGNDPSFRLYHYRTAEGGGYAFYTYTYPLRGDGSWMIDHAEHSQ